jgi:Protein of unknown function (DUF2442)
MALLKRNLGTRIASSTNTGANASYVGVSSAHPSRLSAIRAADVHVTATHLIVDLADGAVIRASLIRFPLLAAAPARERRRWVLIGEGTIIHWPTIDEDIEVAHLVG